jgi:hypothetical protein
MGRKGCTLCSQAVSCQNERGIYGTFVVTSGQAPSRSRILSVAAISGQILHPTFPCVDLKDGHGRLLTAAGQGPCRSVTNIGSSAFRPATGTRIRRRRKQADSHGQPNTSPNQGRSKVRKVKEKRKCNISRVWQGIRGIDADRA